MLLTSVQWFIIVGIEIQLFIAEDGDQRNDRVVAACLRIAGMLSSLSSTHLDLCTDLDSLSSSTMHVLRTACRQETMRYGRLGLPKGGSALDKTVGESETH